MREKLLITVSLMTLAMRPNTLSAQTINMGRAAAFCLFTRTGAMGDNNATQKSIFTGRLGTHVGAYTGFSPVYDDSVGTARCQHETNPTVLLQIADDVDAALAQIRATPDTAPPNASATTLGGQTFLPGVYSLTAAVSLAGDITLDGNNQINPLFIFKIGGAFTTTAPYRVLLINGAILDNVFWSMGGAVTLVGGNTSIFRGIILATPAGAISIGNQATLLGKALTQAGAVNLDDARMSNAELVIAGPLPVELTSFLVEQQGRRALLRWTTAMEKNNAYFAMERSTDGKVFAEIGRVAGQGSSTHTHTYEWADVHLTQYAVAMVYYRLHQVDADGSSTYSPVRTVARPLADGLHMQAYPNPTGHQFGVRMEVCQAGPATLQLIDNTGRIVMKRDLVLATGTTTLALDEARELRPGLYQVQLQQGAQLQLVRLLRD